MTTKFHNIVLDGIGVGCLALATVAFSYNIVTMNAAHVWWLCYVATMLGGIALVWRKPNFFAAQMVLFFVPSVIWLTDFAYQFISETPLWGVSDYVFMIRPWIANVISAIHGIVLVLGVIALSLLPALHYTRIWLFAMVELAGLYIISSLTSSVDANINCVHSLCLPLPLFSIPYVLYWVLLGFVMLGVGIGFVYVIKKINHQ